VAIGGLAAWFLYQAARENFSKTRALAASNAELREVMAIAAHDLKSPLLDVATRTTFATLTDTQHEIVIGTVVVAPPGVRRARQPTPEELLLVQRRDGFAVGTLNFAVSDRGGGVCDLTTTTRVFATGRRSKLAFGAYWRVIYPGSSLIRYMWLRAIKQRAEAPV
jgi:hypothetical protein